MRTKYHDTANNPCILSRPPANCQVSTAEGLTSSKRNLSVELPSFCHGRSDLPGKKLVISHDAIGRRTAKNTETYGYNDRNELTSASTGYAYAYDDIGNRLTATEPSTTSTYTVNELNQYTLISGTGVPPVQNGDFAPTYDLDGNQTLVETSTGIWSVEYNGENRPVTWTRTNDNTVVTMDFDRLGRRTYYKEMQGNTQISFTRFFYDGYVMIQQLYSNAPYNLYKEFIWDPTEPVATKPLCFRQTGETATFYTHDGNKNVSDVITVGPSNAQVGHYEYAPFGAVTSATGSRASSNPYRFSSEFHDDTLGLVYYNYRHYNPKDGRWLNRDTYEHASDVNLYGFIENGPIQKNDILGLFCENECDNQGDKRVKRVYYKIYPASWGDDINANLKADASVDEISDAATIASVLDGGISGGVLGAAVGYGTSELQGSIPSMGYEAVKNFKIILGGAKIWTKVVLEECDCVSCFILWEHLAWVEDEESEWKQCTCGSMSLSGFEHVFQSPNDKQISNCIKAHAESLGVGKPKKGGKK